MGNAKKCCVTSCEAEGYTVHRFPNPRHDMDLFNLWLQILCIDELNSLQSEKVYSNKRVCFAHFKPSCKSAGNPRLHRYSVPTIGVPVVKELDVREFVKGFVPAICKNDTTDNSKDSSKPVESNANDLVTKSDKIVEEPEVTPTPILFVASSTDCKEEEVLTTSNKQPRTDCDPLKERIVQTPQCTGQRNVESSMKTERNWNLVINENSALHKRVNLLEIQNRRLDRRVRSMKILLRHYKNMHAR